MQYRVSYYRIRIISAFTYYSMSAVIIITADSTSKKIKAMKVNRWAKALH